MTLKEYFKNVYENDAKFAVSQLADDTFLKENNWERVFREGWGDGIYSPNENIVIMYDEDDLDLYHDYEVELYTEDWKKLSMS